LRKDTIFALSSGAPPAAIAIIRISGVQAGPALKTLAGRLPEPRTASLAILRDPVNGDMLDRALTLWFPGPGTATGEDLAELHCHGGRAVAQALLAALACLPGLRSAEAGEFTRRAFENGRIDLSEAEGLADLLAAETQNQRRAALVMAEGHFSRKVSDWQDRLLGLSALAEAALDFSDEDDVPDEGIERRIAEGVAQLAAEVGRELAKPGAERLRDGVRVVIAGPPNAGKSTLLNALAGRDAAIVSSIAGTTRDRIEVPVALGGTAFVLTDTAGLRAGEDEVESIGIARAEAAIEGADILLWLGDPHEAPRADAIRVSAQSDRQDRSVGSDMALSALTGEGVEVLIEALLIRARSLLPAEGDYALHARQREAVAQLAVYLDEGIAARDGLMMAESLRLARRMIDMLTGRAGTEDMLDVLFGRFCIGK
jgi:tRNA modification GTPase